MRVDSRLNDLQEIVFWQQLNRQLREIGPVPSEGQYPLNLRDFCLNNRAFSKLTSSRIAGKLPTALLSDSAKLVFFTFNGKSWTSLLKDQFTELLVLDVDEALAESFDITKAYADKYQLIIQEAGDDLDDHDDALYAFMEKYRNLEQDLGTDLRSLVDSIYDSRVDFLHYVLENGGSPECIEGTGEQDRLAFVFEGGCDFNVAIRQYEYCTQVNEFTKIRLEANKKVVGFLKDELKRSTLDGSVREFITEEMKTVLLEHRVISALKREVAQRPMYESREEIPICLFKPFLFLEYPFPPT